MSIHIYAFGSVVRGEIDSSSDVDLLAIVHEHEVKLDDSLYSIYSQKRINELWTQGNPFAWHLHLESKLIFTSNGDDFLHSLGKPSRYVNGMEDCRKFQALYKASQAELAVTNSPTFEMSTIFLALRNFATCYSLHARPRPVFSRRSAMLLGERSLPLSQKTYMTLERARILSTRGIGECINEQDKSEVSAELHLIQNWMSKLSNEVSEHD